MKKCPIFSKEMKHIVPPFLTLQSEQKTRKLDFSQMKNDNIHHLGQILHQKADLYSYGKKPFFDLALRREK